MWPFVVGERRCALGVPEGHAISHRRIVDLPQGCALCFALAERTSTHATPLALDQGLSPSNESIGGGWPGSVDPLSHPGHH